MKLKNDLTDFIGVPGVMDFNREEPLSYASWLTAVSLFQANTSVVLSNDPRCSMQSR
jgi:hypothetical protein